MCLIQAPANTVTFGIVIFFIPCNTSITFKGGSRFAARISLQPHQYAYDGRYTAILRLAYVKLGIHSLDKPCIQHGT